MRYIISVLIFFISMGVFMYFLLVSYENEDSLLADFNNKAESLAESRENVVDYKPSIQLAVNGKARMEQGDIEDILRNERLIFQWSRGLPEKYSGRYLVLMSVESNRSTLVGIVRFCSAATVRFTGVNMEVSINEVRGKYDFEIKTKTGGYERIDNRNDYDLKSDVVYISSYDIDNKHYWLYSLIVR